MTNRNASVLLVPVAVYVGLGDPTYLSGVPFLLRGELCLRLSLSLSMMMMMSCIVWDFGDGAALVRTTVDALVFCIFVVP